MTPIDATGPSGILSRKALTQDQKVVYTRILVILGVVVFWEIAGRFLINPAFLAPPTHVVRALFTTIFASPEIRYAIWLALVEVTIAYALAVVVGIAIGLAVGITEPGRKAMFPIIVMIWVIPNITLLPLFMVVFGLGPVGKIAYAFSGGIFPIMVNVIAGMRNVNQLYVRGTQSMGGSRLDELRHVVFPNMVPSLFTGLRLGMIVTMLGVIASELYVSANGIGYYTRLYSEVYDPAPLFALILTLAVISITLNELVRLAERRFTRWRR
ncbi:MAG TPA: ABC transporter permease [Rhizobiaceae bacterium]|nr:ABC transporter permease [Rhizobiaceae bacterium]